MKHILCVLAAMIVSDFAFAQIANDHIVIYLERKEGRIKATLIVEDSLGRKTGKDPVSEIRYNEIPNAGYGDTDVDSHDPNASGIYAKEFIMDPAVKGIYTIKVIGAGTDTFDLSINMERGFNNGAEFHFNGTTSYGQITEYKIYYDPDTSQTLWAKPVSPLPDLSAIALLATHSIWLEQNAEILSGSVIVNASGDPPFLDSEVALSVGISASVAAGCELKASSIKVKQNATVAGNVYYNELTNNGTITGTLNTPLSLPVVPALPPFQSATPGTENLSLAQDEEQTLTPGDYGDIIVMMEGRLIFTGGIYNLRSLSCGDNTKLVFRAASEVRIAEKFETGQGSSIGAEAGAAVAAKDIVFYVAGINGTTGNLGATPKAAKIGLSNTVSANFYVPNGTLWLRQGSVVEGAFIAKDVIVGLGVKVSLNSAW